MLLDFLVDRVTAQVGIVFLLLNPALLLLFVTGGHVTGRRFAFSAGFSAFQDDVFAWHGLI